MFGATTIVKNSDKDNWRIVALKELLMEEIGGVLVMALLEIFSVDNSSSSYVDNLKNNFLIPVKGSTFGINESFGSPEKYSPFSINSTKAPDFSQFCLGSISNGFSAT